jgi:hypothetical protein
MNQPLPPNVFPPAIGQSNKPAGYIYPPGGSATQTRNGTGGVPYYHPNPGRGGKSKSRRNRKSNKSKKRKSRKTIRRRR